MFFSMKPIHLLLAGLLVGGVYLDGDVSLKRRVGDAKPEVYKVVFHENRVMNSEYFNDMEVDTTRNCTVRIETAKSFPDADKADVNLVYKVDDEVIDGPNDGTYPEHKPLALKGVLDGQGNFAVDLDKASQEERMTRIVLSPAETNIIVPLPEKSIKVGDTWDLPIPVRVGAKQEPQKLTAKLVGEKKVGSQTAWVIGVTGTVSVNTEQLISLDIGGKKIEQTFLTKATSDVQGDVLIDQSTGRTIRSLTKLKTRSVTTITNDKSESRIDGVHSATIATTAE